MLHDFIAANRDTILARTRVQAASRTSKPAAEGELKNGVPHFLDQIVDRLRRVTEDEQAIGASATLHGGALQGMGFTVSQVIQGYGDVCQVVTALAAETNAPISAGEFHLFNVCLDIAMASAVTEYQRRREASAAESNPETSGVLAHEMRNRLNAVSLAYSLLRGGTVAIGGTTGTVLGRNLQSLRNMVNNSLLRTRVEVAVGRRSRIVLAEVIADLEEEALLEIAGNGSRLVVDRVEPGIELEVDREILTAAIGNLLQNAFKFNRPSCQVSLRATATLTRVLVEVEDECGGLPEGQAEDLFRPYEQRGANRSGLGLGLSISRRGIEGMGGTLGVRNLPGQGCVFFVDLPRLGSMPGQAGMPD